jgi:hypothetical protein
LRVRGVSISPKYFLTARHVLFPPNEGPNVDYAHTNTRTPRRDVLLLGTKAFDNLLESIKTRIKGHGFMVELYGREIEDYREREASKDERVATKATRGLKAKTSLLYEAIEAIKVLEEFHDQVKREWRLSQRVLGHIVRSPPITFSAGTEGFTEDYAVIELDSSKIKEHFKGNAIDLGAF